MKKLIFMACALSFLGAPAYSVTLKNESGIPRTVVMKLAHERSPLITNGKSQPYTGNDIIIQSIEWYAENKFDGNPTCKLDDITVGSDKTITLNPDKKTCSVK